MATNLTGKFIQGDIWLSRAIIKNILYYDMSKIKNEDIKNYISEMIKRLDKITINK